MGGIVGHTGLWPLYVVEVRSSLTTDDMRSYVDEVAEVHGRGERFATLVETRQLEHVPDAATRRYLAEFQNANRAYTAKLNVTTAVVVASPLIRGAMTAVSWLFTPASEQRPVPTLAEGITHCIRALEADGQAVPDALREVVDDPPDDLPSLLRL